MLLSRFTSSSLSSANKATTRNRWYEINRCIAKQLHDTFSHMMFIFIFIFHTETEREQNTNIPPTSCNNFGVCCKEKHLSGGKHESLSKLFQINVFDVISNSSCSYNSWSRRSFTSSTQRQVFENIYASLFVSRFIYLLRETHSWVMFS